MQSLGKIAQCPSGCRCENVVFVFSVCWSSSESGAPYVRESRSSNKHCVTVYSRLRHGFSFFSEVIALLHELHGSHFCR